MTWQAAAEAHAASEAPREACGLLVATRGRLRYLPAENVADDPREGFTIPAVAFEAAEDIGEVVAVVHSHPGASSTPSQADEAGHRGSCLAWWILGDDGWHHMPAAGAAPYAGRPFVYGEHDCLELVRAWFWRERGIFIAAREELAAGQDFSYEWWLRGGDLYRQLFAAAGFEASTDTRPGDVLLMQVGAPVPNHIGIMLPGGRILHHLDGRISGTEPYDRFYRERTIHVLRHVGTPQDPPPG